MEPRDRVLGPIAFVVQDGSEDPVISVDFGSLVRKLILSEQIVLESLQLKEFPLLVQKFGYGGVKELLDSGRVRVLRDVVFFGNIGQLEMRTNGPILPLGSYSFSALQAHTPKPMVSDQLRRINEVPGLSARHAKKLRELVARRLAGLPETGGKASEERLKQQLEANIPLLKQSVALATRRDFRVDIEPADFDLRVVRLSEWDWRTETNLGDHTGLSLEQVHQAVGNGLSGVGGLQLRFELMSIFEALTGFHANELPLMEEHLDFLARQLDPDVNEARLDRVLEIGGLPVVNPDPSVDDVDLPRLLEITGRPEAQEFRRWLRGIDSCSDEELAEAFQPVRDALGEAVRSRGGKTVRLATTTGVGIVVPPVGIGLGVLDMFLTEKILPGPGPTAFLSRLYPSVFPKD